MSFVASAVRPAARATIASAVRHASTHHKIVIIGGGTGGINIANQLLDTYAREAKSSGSEALKKDDIAIVDGASLHHYQPGWTLVGAGLANKTDLNRPLASLVPSDVRLHNANVAEIDAAANKITTATGDSITYDHLIVAAGLDIKWGAIAGLPETLGKNGVSSIYSYDTCDVAQNDIKALKCGKAIFTQPAGVVKCAGAPQKVMWMAEDAWRSAGIRDEIDLEFNTGMGAMFAVPKYAKALEQLRVDRGVKGAFTSDLVAVDGQAHIATFKQADGTTVDKTFDLLHVVPKMGSHAFVAKSALADAAGFVDVDAATLQSKKFDNVWSLGDSSSLPTSKTAAAIFSQTPVLAHNFHRVAHGKTANASYDGYTSCPLLVSYGKLILAEFKYGGVPDETFGSKFGFDQAKPARFAYHLKKDVFPWAYFNYAMKGQWFGRNSIFRPTFN
ncbi:hypothetical protein YB2330_004023 [Saitoella coloradoensis]